MFVYSIVPKVQETQGADRRKKEEKKKEKEKKSLALSEPISGVADLSTCIWTRAQTGDHASVIAYRVPFPRIHVPPRSTMLPRNEHFLLFLPLVRKMPMFNISDKMNSSQFSNSSCAKGRQRVCVFKGREGLTLLPSIMVQNNNISNNGI